MSLCDLREFSAKKVIYIAGPYRSSLGEYGVLENIRNAAKYAIMVWQHGGVALCPHKNTAFFGGVPGTSDETWLEGDLELLRRCDAVWAIPGWSTSEGAQREIEFAKQLDIPVFYHDDELIDFLG